MVDSLEKTLVEGVGKQVFTCWNFWASKREEVARLNACISVHRTNQSIVFDGVITFPSVYFYSIFYLYLYALSSYQHYLIRVVCM